MARNDSWAQMLRVALPVLDGVRPSGVLGWAGPVTPVVTRAAVGAGHWTAGRRRRALAAWAGAAGFGLVAWGLGTEAPTPAEARQNMQQNIERLQREGVLREPGPEARTAAETETPAASPSRYDPLFKRLATAMDHRLFKSAVIVVGMVTAVWWGLRWPRRLSVLAVAGDAPYVVVTVLLAARAVQRRRPRIAVGYALILAGSAAKLRAASAEPLR